MRALPPLWLVQPTRYARLTRPQARWVLALLLAFLAVSFTALWTPAPRTANDDTAARSEDRLDVALYESVVAGIRNGGNYYVVAADAQRAGSYPLRPFVTMRLPTLAVVQAALPDAVTLLLLYALAAGTFAAWLLRLRPLFTRRPPLLAALVLLAGGMMAYVQSDLVAFHEVWAGLLVALSLAVRRRERWVEAVAIALCAILIRETAVLFVAIMGATALAEGRRREALGWAAAVAVLAVVLAFHAHAVAGVVHATDPASPGWAGLLGFGFFVRTMSLSTGLALAPLWLAAPLVALALFGWSVWKDPTALRALATLCGYAVLIACFGRVDTFYWGLLVAPILLVGLVFVPDGLRDVIARMLDKRRITVTRRTQ